MIVWNFVLNCQVDFSLELNKMKCLSTSMITVKLNTCGCGNISDDSSL